MKKIFRKIHLWLSVPFGLIITIICFSGAMLVFEDEVTECFRHDLFFVEQVASAPLAADSIAAIVSASLPDSVSVNGVSIFSDPNRAWQVSLSKPRRASVYVDQYTGEIKGKYERSGFFMTMFRLHRWLLDTMKPDGKIFWGKVIVGTATLMFVLVLISGVVIWWPRTVKALKNSLKIMTGKGWHRFWYDLHIAGGMYALILLLVMALTGLTWSFSWYRTGFYKVFGVQMEQSAGGHGAPSHGANQGQSSTAKRERGERPADEAKAESNRAHNRGDRSNAHSGESIDNHQQALISPFGAWQTVFDELKSSHPDFHRITISNGTASVAFNGLGNRRAADKYSFDARTGAITEATLYKDLPASGKIRGWIYSVHVGDWGGMTTRILTFLAALIGASLPLTGYYFWIRRLAKKRKKDNGLSDAFSA